MRTHPHHPLTSRRAALALAALLSVSVLGCTSGAGDTSDGSSASSTPNTTGTTVPERPTKPELPEGREIEVKVPAGYDPDVPAPLVVLLHGYGVDGATQDAYFRFSETADAMGMIAVAPSGTENAVGDRFWNATDACCAVPGSEVDDVGYLLEVIDTVKADYTVDPKRVYLVGHSNGGFMSFRMACDHADVIAAIASLAGATFADPEDCRPSEPVATLQIHGTGDETIRYDGGTTSVGGDEHPYPGALDTLETWATNNGCDLDPDDPAPEPRSIIQDAEPATVIAHSDCDPGGHAELWTAPGGVHIPAITPDFSEQVLDFLLAHPKP